MELNLEINLEKPEKETGKARTDKGQMGPNSMVPAELKLPESQV